MPLVIVASQILSKYKLSKTASPKCFPGKLSAFRGPLVPSGVSDQPMSDQETLTGAVNRAEAAKLQFPEAAFWVGVEGGIEQDDRGMTAFAWIVIQSNNQEGKGRTGAFYLPPKVVELIHQGMELGEADDIVFGHTNSKQQGGAVGLLTDNVVTRTSLYEQAVIFALIPFYNPAYYS